jgi:hypothetical protein
VLSVNPFSAMTPGFLRKIFGAIDGTTPALSSQQPLSMPSGMR